MARTRNWSQRELRYRLDRATAERVLAVIAQRLPTITYVPGTIDSVVVTTYLDTEDRHYLGLVDSSDGLRSVKTRIREYLARTAADAPLTYRDTCFLERKERVEDLRLKQRLEIPKTEIGRVLRGEQRVQDSFSEAHAIGAELDALELAPVLVSAYERCVFGTETELRVTFDQRLAYHLPPSDLYDSAPALLPSVLGSPAASGPSRILEVKYPADSTVPEWLQTLLAPVPTAFGFSKFRDGMQALARSDGRAITITRPISIGKRE